MKLRIRKRLQDMDLVDWMIGGEDHIVIHILMKVITRVKRMMKDSDNVSG